MKSKIIFTIMVLTLLPVLLLSCVTLKPGAETWEHRIGRTAAEIILSNNPDYIPEVKQGIEDGLRLVTGQDIDPARALQGITDFVNKLTAGKWQDYKKIVDQVLDFARDIVQLNLQIPEDKQKAADMIAEFFRGAQQWLNTQQNQKR